MITAAITPRATAMRDFDKCNRYNQSDLNNLFKGSTKMKILLRSCLVCKVAGNKVPRCDFLERGRGLRAYPFRIRAARVELATGRWAYRTRNLTGDLCVQ